MIYLRVRHENSVHHPVLSEHVSTNECVSLTQKIQRTSKEHDMVCQNENTARNERPETSCSLILCSQFLDLVRSERAVSSEK